MSVNISQFRNRIMGQLPGCPIPRIDEEIVSAIRDFCEDSLVMRKTVEAVSEYVEGYGSFDYTFEESASGEYYIAGVVLTAYDILDDMDGISPIYCRLNNVDTGLILFDLDNDITILNGMAPATKKFYRFVRSGEIKTMEIFPFQVNAGPNTIVVTLAMEPEIDSTTVHDDFWYNYRRAVEAKCLYNLMSIPGQPWSNEALAAFNESVYNSQTGKHKLRTGMGNMTGDMIAVGGYI